MIKKLVIVTLASLLLLNWTISKHDGVVHQQNIIGSGSGTVVSDTFKLGDIGEKFSIQYTCNQAGDSVDIDSIIFESTNDRINFVQAMDSSGSVAWTFIDSVNDETSRMTAVHPVFSLEARYTVYFGSDNGTSDTLFLRTFAQP